MPGELPENTWISDEMVSGPAPAGIADLRHRVVEAAAAVADVEDDAALLGGQRRRQQLAVLHDVGERTADVGSAGIGSG